METWEWIVIAGAAVLLVVLALAFFRIRRRRAHLKERFGPEYYRAVSESSTGEAEKRLSGVERTHEELPIRPLPPAARDRYLDEWRQAETRFVSDPREAVRVAERLVERVLEERGYPPDGDVERRVALVAVDHPDVAERYRHGHAMLAHVDGDESTENLRRAMIDFRSVLEELLETSRRAA
ncbi:MAG TPA: hypothetical protein VI540_04765 [Gaiellaceae bacterium]|nr:hypothetical protein [Gaiellaceae bacterium]